MNHSDAGGSGEMTDEQLDQLLAAANSELLEHIEATTDPGHVLNAIMTRGGRQDRPAGPGGPPASHDPGQSPAAAMISFRIHARALAIDLGRGPARMLASALADDLARASRSAWALADRALANDLARASDLAGILAGDLDDPRDLVRALVRVLADDLGGLTYNEAVIARYVMQGLPDSAIAARLGLKRRAIEKHLAQIFTKMNVSRRGIADALTDRLDALQVDASDADLSGLDIRQLDSLEGVIWTRGTAWPADVAARVEAHSEVIRPGVYQVRLGNTPDRNPLARV